MNPRKLANLVRLGGLGFIVALLLTARLLAQEPSTPSATGTNLPAFRLRGFQENLAPHWQMQHQLLVYSNTQITFTVPNEYRVQADAASKSVTMDYQGNQILNGSCRITLRLSALPQTTNALDAAWLHKRIVAEHPEARVVDEFPAALASSPGVGMELQTARQGIATSRRVILVALPETLVEITEVAGTEFISKHVQTLNEFMLSTRFSPLGTKVEYQTFKLE